MLKSSVADLERFGADPDPTFQADADPDPDPTFFLLGREKKIIFKIFIFFFSIILQNLWGMREEGWGV